MEGPVQLEFAEFARAASEGPGTGKSRPEASEAIRGPSRAPCGAIPSEKAGGASASLDGGGSLRPKPENRQKGRYVAVVFLEEDDGRGNLRLRKVTTSRYVTVGQIAASLGVSDQAIYQRVQSGEFDCGPMPVDRVGSAIRIPVETFLRWRELHVAGAEYERPARGDGVERLKS